MTRFVSILEIADASGRGTGKFRRTTSSDDPKTPPRGLCDHEHDTRDEAGNCPDAKVWSDNVETQNKPIDEPFRARVQVTREIVYRESGEFEVDCIDAVDGLTQAERVARACRSGGMIPIGGEWKREGAAYVGECKAEMIECGPKAQ